MKLVCDAITGMLLFLKIQRGKDGMANMPFVNDMIKTAACTARLMQGSKLTYDNAATSDSEDSDNESLELLNNNNNNNINIRKKEEDGHILW